MENDKALLLAHTAMKHVSLSEPVNVMLTPQFYTLKKESLPVTYAYQAKRLAGSLFEGLLEREGKYDFLVFKEGEYWNFIAYDLEKITDFLQSKGFRQGEVSKIFFAQQAVEKFTAPCLLSDKDALAVLDGTVVLVPATALDSEASSFLKFDKHFTPKKGISLEAAASSIFTFRQAVFFSSVFICFAIMFFIEGARYGGENQSTKEELGSLYANYPSLQSTYTRKGIFSKYRKLDKEERTKRDAIKRLSGMIFKGVTLTTLYVENQSIKANFSCSSNKVAQRVEALAKKSQFKVSKIKDSNDLHMEGSI